MMKIRRTLPPAAVPLSAYDLIEGLRGWKHGKDEVSKFEIELKDYISVKHCFLVSSGKAALSIILSALKDIYPERTDVLIPAFCCYSVPSAIVHAGLNVKICDIEPKTLDYNFEMLETMLSSKEDCKNILAIVAVHLFGIESDIGKIRKIIKDPAVNIVEDAAQALGGTYNSGKKIGTKGDASVFSLGRGKSFSVIEGGIIATNNYEIATRVTKIVTKLCEYNVANIILLLIKCFVIMIFQRPSLFWLPKSIPLLKIGETIYNPHFKARKMSAFQVGLAKNWKTRLEELISIRRRKAMQWKELLGECNKDMIGSVNTSIDLLIRYPALASKHSIQNRIIEESERLGLGISQTYPDSIDGIADLDKELQNHSYQGAKLCSRRLMTLPIHPFVSDLDVLKTKSIFRKFKLL